MNEPKLRHPILILILPSDKNETLQDQNAREPVQIIKRKAQILIKGQAEYRETLSAGLGKLNPEPSGSQHELEGYYAFRYKDAKLKGWIPKIDDKIIKVGVGSENEQEVNLYIEQIKPFAHYPGRGATMFKAFFKDRKPSRV